MKLVVLVKEVPDTEARIELAGGKPDVSAVKMVPNPYDEYAVEEAVLQAEKHPGSSITAVMFGSEASRKNLTQVLAQGVDDAILIDTGGSGSLAGDPLTIARALAAAVKPLGADVILAGRQGVDYDWGLTAIAVAELLGIAHVALVSKVEISRADTLVGQAVEAGRSAGPTFRAESEGDDGRLVTEGSLPAVFTTDKGINEPRLPNLKGIMAAKKKTITVKSLAEMGVESGVARVELVSAELPPPRAGGRMIEGSSAAEKVSRLVEALRNEAKVL